MSDAATAVRFGADGQQLSMEGDLSVSLMGYETLREIQRCSRCIRVLLVAPLLHRGTPDRSLALPGHVLWCWFHHSDIRSRADIVVNQLKLHWICGSDSLEDNRRA